MSVKQFIAQMHPVNDNNPCEELAWIAERFLVIGERYLDKGDYLNALDALLMSKEIYQKLGAIHV